ncbi:MAG: hypothetical protein ACREBB_08775 [Nitrosotalea sp.]
MTKEEKITAPVILAVIAGSLMLIGGMVSLGMMIGYHTMYGGHRMLGMMMYNGLQSVMPQITPWIIGISIGSMVCGGIILYSSYLLHTMPQAAKTWGIVILIVSMASFFLGHGFWIGPALGIIAGVIVISRK